MAMSENYQEEPGWMSEEYWKQNYNTALTDKEEAEFKQWTEAQSKEQKRDVSKDDSDYDLSGYWLKEGKKNNGGGHMPDTYKKPNHPTFSTESIYHGRDDLMGGRFNGGKWSGNDKSGWSFEPTYRMLTTTHKLGDMKRYMAKNEKGVKLILPRTLSSDSRRIGATPHLLGRDDLLELAMQEDEEAERN